MRSLTARRVLARKPEMKPADEELLLEYARSHDRLPLETLVTRHWDDAYRTAYRILGDPASADDAAQEAFIKLARAAERLELRGAFGPWFRALLLNAVRDVARRSWRRRGHERRAAETRLELAERRAPSGERAVVADEVASAVRRLPADVRIAVVLHFYEGQTHDEVAALLGCPKGTAASRIRRGVERLRATLGGGVAGIITVEGLEGVLRSAVAEVAVPPAPTAAALVSHAGRMMRRAIFSKALAAVFGAIVFGGATLGVHELARSRSAPPPPAMQEIAGAVGNETAVPGAPGSGSEAAAAPRAGSTPGGRPQRDGEDRPGEGNVGAADARPAGASGITKRGAPSSSAAAEPMPAAVDPWYTLEGTHFRLRTDIPRVVAKRYLSFLDELGEELDRVLGAPDEKPLVEICRFEDPVDAKHGRSKDDAKRPIDPIATFPQDDSGNLTLSVRGYDDGFGTGRTRAALAGACARQRMLLALGEHRSSETRRESEWFVSAIQEFFRGGLAYTEAGKLYIGVARGSLAELRAKLEPPVAFSAVVSEATRPSMSWDRVRAWSLVTYLLRRCDRSGAPAFISAGPGRPDRLADLRGAFDALRDAVMRRRIPEGVFKGNELALHVIRTLEGRLGFPIDDLSRDYAKFFRELEAPAPFGKNARVNPHGDWREDPASCTGHDVAAFRRGGARLTVTLDGNEDDEKLEELAQEIRDRIAREGGKLDGKREGDKPLYRHPRGRVFLYEIEDKKARIGCALIPAGHRTFQVLCTASRDELDKVKPAFERFVDEFEPK